MRYVLIVLLLLATAPSAGAQNPFTDAAPRRQAEETESPPGWVGAVAQHLQQWQRAASKEMNMTLASLHDEQSPRAVLIAVLLAFAYGALHAAGPGHGKAIVMSYFLSRDARIGRGIFLGARIALTHVAAAFLIVAGLTLLFNGRLPTSVEDMREVKLASYLAIVVVGAFLLIDSLRRRRAGLPSASCCAHGVEGHAHDHHGHDHHMHDAQPRKRERHQGWIATAAGFVPCTGAIIILLFSLGNDMLPIGLLLIFAIALGMAMTMAGLGLAAIVARRALLAWTKSGSHDHAPALLDFGGPAFVMLLGVALFWATL